VRARTRALGPGPAVDPLRVAGDGGLYFANEAVTLAGTGRAAVLPLPAGLSDPDGRQAIESWLASVARDDPVGLPGTGAVAFGALAFEHDAPGALVVPAVLYGRAADGTEWATAVGEDPVPEPTREWLLSEVARPTRLEPRVTPELIGCLPADYAEAVAVATRAIARGQMRKVVLARRLTVEIGPSVPGAVLARLAAAEPSSTAFLLGRPDGAFVGASPELLVSRRGHTVLSHPLAGTAAGDGDRLLGSAKDLEEHELVVADIARVLDPLCGELVVPSAPSLVALHTMAHLGTRIEGRLLGEDGRVPTALEVAGLLHPTPAVGGVPRAEALALIAELEPGPRGPWAGAVGWVDADGDGDFVVGLRSAILSGTLATVWAGAGIVAASDPDAELAETAVKLAPVLEGLVPGASALLDRFALRS